MGSEPYFVCDGGVVNPNTLECVKVATGSDNDANAANAATVIKAGV